MDGSSVVAVIGLGRMGRPMASSVAQSGFEVKAWNRSRRATDGLPANLTIVASASQAVAGAGTIIVMLSDSKAVESVLFDEDLAAHIARGAIVIDMGTSGPSAAREHARKLAARGIRYLDAPVSGGVHGAANATLSILAGGDQQTFAEAAPVLACMGRPTYLGPVGSGQTAKLANQLIVAGYIGAVAEGVRFAEQQGMDAAALVTALEGGFADSAVLRQHGRKMAARDFVPGGTCGLHLKDLRLAAELAGADFDRLVHSSEALRRFERLVAEGHEGSDHCAYYLTYEKSAT